MCHMPNDDSVPSSVACRQPSVIQAHLWPKVTSACFLKLDVIFRWDLIFRLSHLLFRSGSIA
ncbi:hypothetical protein A9F13_14g01111 [Clavispora lusitaniae]|uniref:Uncharacterized protein n=1 Tax=Clavispora lusitaniae TaxID=36911 RepID=A0AA91PXP8_CLALS|nr:hypothetical protein A9F13_14g01111 [Clavispora lusitaniae]